MATVIGLTGGIGCGKTLVSDHFSRLGVTIVDTDVIAREAVTKGSPTLRQLSDHFGSHILNAEGELDRAALRHVAFAKKQNKQALDNITHPAIQAIAHQQLLRADGKYCILVVPLLTKKSDFMSMMQRVLLVTATTDIKIERVMQRSKLTREQVLAIMETQISDEQRKQFADDTIENNSSVESVYHQVESLHSTYLKLISD